MSKRNLVLFKKLTIIPTGVITGGFIQYSLDDQTGIVTYSGTVSVHMLFFTKNFDIQGSVQLDPAILISAQIQPGTQYQSNGVQVSINPDRSAGIEIKTGDVAARGIAELDLSEKDVSIKSVDLTGIVKGFTINLKLAA